MSPQFDVQLEMVSKTGILDPQAQTLNRALESMGYEKDRVNFQAVGREISFCIECPDMVAAVKQVSEMIPEPVISNPVIQRVIDVSIIERKPFG